MAIQLARHAGAKVYAVTSGPENVDRVGELGAHVAYDRLENEDWGKSLFADTGKRGVDLVLDSVGQATWKQCLRSLGIGGRLVTYGATTGAPVESDARLIFWKQLSILGSTMGPPSEYRRLMELVFDGHVTPVIHEVMPLGDIQRAHEMLEEGEVFGKLVIEPWS